MSYILDALKKAAEQRGASAAVLLRPAPAARRATPSTMPWLLLGIALVLNAFSLVYLLRPAPPPAPPAAAVAAVAPAPRVEPPLPAPTRILEPAPPAVAPHPAAPSRPAPAARPAPRTSPRLPSGVASVEPRPTPDAPPPTTSPQAGWAKLRLEVLSYSDVAAERLVFINGRRYREGDVVEGGPRIEQIREDSVVLSQQGERFTLR